jgi:DnaJ-class molecular chaperone
MVVAVEESARIECPLCAGRGTSCGPALRRRQTRDRCRLCRGAGAIIRATIQDLIDQMQRVADAVQSGVEDRAGREARKAARIARRWLS